MLTVDHFPMETTSDHPHGIIGALVEYLDPEMYAEKFANEPPTYGPDGHRNLPPVADILTVGLICGQCGAATSEVFVTDGPMLCRACAIEQRRTP